MIKSNFKYYSIHWIFGNIFLNPQNDSFLKFDSSGGANFTFGWIFNKYGFEGILNSQQDSDYKCGGICTLFISNCEGESEWYLPVRAILKTNIR